MPVRVRSSLYLGGMTALGLITGLAVIAIARSGSTGRPAHTVPTVSPHPSPTGVAARPTRRPSPSAGGSPALSPTPSDMPTPGGATPIPEWVVFPPEMAPLPGDWDNDGLVAADEVAHLTDEYEWDTDRGGESDGSEVAAERDPLDKTDDLVQPSCIPPGSRNWDGSSPAESPPPAPELEAVIPKVVGGQRVQVGSMQGLPRAYGFFNYFWDALLHCAGGQPEDLAHAIGVRGRLPAFTILAIRVDGVTGTSMAADFAAELTRGTGRTLALPQSIDGRDFTFILDAEREGFSWAVYGNEDTLFLMTGMGVSDAGLWPGEVVDPELVREAVVFLPR